MTEIYLIRHAQAEGNRYRMMQGHWDGDVTPVGRQQIQALARRFREQRVDALYSSDLYRARLTAGALQAHRSLPLHSCEDLREINVGPWEGCFFANVDHEQPELAHKFMFQPDLWSIPGAETYEQVTRRAFAALEQIVRDHEGERIALVSHGVTIRCLLSRITGISLRDTKGLPICRNTAVSLLRYEDGQYSVVYMNDHSHLAELPERPWGATADLRHEVLDLRREPDYYRDCYADAWRSAHGDLEGFVADSYLRAALAHQRDCPQAVLRICRGDEAVGLIDLDTARGQAEGYGWISLLYLRQDYRGKDYGVQLLARAVSLYRQLGRRSLRLHVAEDNLPALAFYRREGFAPIGREPGNQGDLLLMERSLEGAGHV